MELRHYLQILRRRKWVVISTFVATLSVVGAATIAMTPIYSASATVRIAQIQDRSIDYFDLNYSVRLINTYVELVRSRPFLEQTIERLELAIDPLDLAKSVKVESLSNTELLKITAESGNSATAMLIANTLGELLVDEGAKLYSGRGRSASEILLEQLVAIKSELGADRAQLSSLQSGTTGEALSPEAQDLQTRIDLQEQLYGSVLDAYENAALADEARANSVTIVEPAVVPHSPSKPSPMLNIALGALLGLAGGIGMALVYENLDTAVYSPEDLGARSQAPILASIPDLKIPAKLRGWPVLLRANGKSSAAEAFRILRSNVQTMDSGRPPRSILVTSVEVGAGKSTVLANLAAAFGEAGRKVVAVDSNLRGPTLDRVFNVPNVLGLKNVILQRETLGSAIQKTRVPGVQVLPSGPPAHNPAELLGLPNLRAMVGDLADWADLVLLDSPPLSKFSDAIVLAPLVDSIVLVVRRGKASQGQIGKAVAQLVNVGTQQVGIVFNRAGTGEVNWE